MMKRFLLRHWFLLALIALLAIGFLCAQALKTFADDFPTKALVATVLFLMSWTLDSAKFGKAIGRPKAATLGVAVNMIIVPLLAWGVSRFLPSPLDVGMILAAAVPCTLASAAVWTRRAAGNDAVALVVTMVTNFACFVTTPLTLLYLSGADVRGATALQGLVFQLFVIAVLPMLAGQLVRLIPTTAEFATENKTAVSVVAQLGILTMVLIGAARAGAKLASPGALSFTYADILLMLAAVCIVHVAALYGGFALGRAAGLPREDWIAVGIAGSQKTLMIGLVMALALDLGIGMLPMIGYHAVQLIIDTIVADRLAAQTPEIERSPGLPS